MTTTRISNVILFALVFSLAATDWLSAPTIAQDGGAAPAPERPPSFATLSGATLRRAFVEGLDVELEGEQGRGFTLVLHNPSGQARTAHLEVVCVQRTGSPIGRMGPVPRVVHTELVEVTVAARSSVRRRLEADVLVPPPGPEPSQEQLLLGATFTSTSFELRSPGHEPGVAPLAVLLWPAAIVEPG